MHELNSEFTLIKRLFERFKTDHPDVVFGIGDDAAVLQVPTDTQLVVTTDTMVEGNHFNAQVPPEAVGHKLVAMNLSDLAAMGAEPAWLSLSLTLPQIDTVWLDKFSTGFFELSHYYQSVLIGGDVTRGPLTLTVTAQGLVPKGRALYRSGAQSGDRIYVSGSLGDAAAALAGLQGQLNISEFEQKHFNQKLFYPRPQVALGQALRGIAHSVIDLSDGLASDLQHLLTASNKTAHIYLEKLPSSAVLLQCMPEHKSRALFQAISGEEYELCFTVPESRRGNLETVAKQLAVPITCIGVVEGPIQAKKSLLTFSFEQTEVELTHLGFTHFGD